MAVGCAVQTYLVELEGLGWVQQPAFQYLLSRMAPILLLHLRSIHFPTQSFVSYHHLSQSLIAEHCLLLSVMYLFHVRLVESNVHVTHCLLMDPRHLPLRTLPLALLAEQSLPHHRHYLQGLD